MIHKLFPFIGGVHPPTHKEAAAHAISTTALPAVLILPLRQHIGAPSEPVVEVGEQVLKGQQIAKATDYISSPLHAPTSGIVTAIKPHTVPHPSGMEANCIFIEPDGRDQWFPLQSHAENFRSLDPSALRNLIRNAGIVGLGGAGFPSSVKLNPGPGREIDTLIINASECEPYITCDDRLMRERADEVIQGIIILQHAIAAQHCIIATEDNKTQAIEALQHAISEQSETRIKIVAVPTIYPAGGEKQLIHAVTGRVVPSHGLPSHVGVLCQNVGTVVAIYRAIQFGEPLISRILTVTGDVGECSNLEVLIGTPLHHIIAHSKTEQRSLRRVIMGGPMMGFAVHNLDVPVTKTTNCILCDGKQSTQFKIKPDAMPCIRCGACAEACPVKLLPQQLYWHSKAEDFEQTESYHLFDCIECGCCDYVCPSNIPLVQYYRYAKSEIWARHEESRKADIARERHEFRQFRQEREKAEKAAKHKQKRAALKAQQGEEQVDADKEAKRAAILAAMERAKEKKAQSGARPKNTERLTAEQQKQIADADARRAARKLAEQNKTGESDE